VIIAHTLVYVAYIKVSSSTVGWLSLIWLLVTLWVDKCAAGRVVATTVSASKMWIVCLKSQRRTNLEHMAIHTINYRSSGRTSGDIVRSKALTFSFGDGEACSYHVRGLSNLSLTWCASRREPEPYKGGDEYRRLLTISSLAPVALVQTSNTAAH
jgi:hypothetical protein